MRLGQAPARFPARAAFRGRFPGRLCRGFGFRAFFRLAGGSSFIFRHKGGFRDFRRTGVGRFLNRIAFCRFFCRDIFSRGALCGIAFLSRRFRLRDRFFLIGDGGLIRMLGDGDGAHDRVLCHSQRDAVVFQGKISRLRAYGINSFVQQVPLAGGHFTDAVIRAAGVFLGGEFAPVRPWCRYPAGFRL